MKYKPDLKKYRNSEVEKYKTISNKIERSRRADLVDMCPDFNFFMKRLDVFMNILRCKKTLPEAQRTQGIDFIS